MPGYDRAFVQVNKVSMHFGLVEAVRQVSFDVTQGTIFGLVGSDGAGKSTLLRMIATMIKPASGTILIDGLDAVSEKKAGQETNRLYASALRSLSGPDGQ